MTIYKNNAVLDANGGLHSQRALDTAISILKHHDLCQPVLFHLVLTGGQVTDYQATIKALARRLRNHGCRIEYFGGYESAEDKGGVHAHCFLLIETSKKSPFRIMSIADGDYLHKLADRKKINRIHVAKPQNPMHGSQFFARPVEAGGKLANCLEWVKYAYKSRSKAGVQRRETYFNSEFNANTAKRTAAMQTAGFVSGGVAA
jgi:hypothetical protein